MDGYDFRKAVILAIEYLGYFGKEECTFEEPIEIEDYSGKKKKVIPSISYKEVM